MLTSRVWRVVTHDIRNMAPETKLSAELPSELCNLVVLHGFETSRSMTAFSSRSTYSVGELVMEIHLRCVRSVCSTTSYVLIVSITCILDVTFSNDFGYFLTSELKGGGDALRSTVLHIPCASGRSQAKDVPI